MLRDTTAGGCGEVPRGWGREMKLQGSSEPILLKIFFRGVMDAAKEYNRTVARKV